MWRKPTPARLASLHEQPPRRERASRLDGRALLRPRVRVRVHAGDDALARAGHLGRVGAGPAGDLRAVVGMGELRLADERGRRRGRLRPGNDAVRDRRAVRGRPRRPGGIRRAAIRVRRRVLHGSRQLRRALRARGQARAGPARGGAADLLAGRCRGRAHRRGCVHAGGLAARDLVARPRHRILRAAASPAWRAGGSTRRTSRSATG